VDLRHIPQRRDALSPRLAGTLNRVVQFHLAPFDRVRQEESSEDFRGRTDFKNRVSVNRAVAVAAQFPVTNDPRPVFVHKPDNDPTLCLPMSMRSRRMVSISESEGRLSARAKSRLRTKQNDNNRATYQPVHGIILQLLVVSDRAPAGGPMIQMFFSWLNLLCEHIVLAC